MGELVSQAKIFVDGPFGNFQLLKVKSIDASDERDAEVVMAVGVGGGAGYRFKEGGGELTMEVYREQGLPEVNWRREQVRKTVFTITMQDVGGQREQFQSVIVAQVTRKDDESGSHMDTVKLKYLRFKQLAPSVAV